MRIISLIPLLGLMLLSTGCKSSILENNEGSVALHFSVAQRSHVKLTIENTYNTTVATLVDLDMQAGDHMVSFSPSSFPSGVYYYVLTQTGIGTTYYYNRTRYMLMVKP